MMHDLHAKRFRLHNTFGIQEFQFCEHEFRLISHFEVGYVDCVTADNDDVSISMRDQNI